MTTFYVDDPRYGDDDWIKRARDESPQDAPLTAGGLFYSEDQPRDERGRFGETSGGPPGPEKGVSPKWDRLPPSQKEAIGKVAAGYRVDYDDMVQRAEIQLRAAQDYHERIQSIPEDQRRGMDGGPYRDPSGAPRDPVVQAADWYERMGNQAADRAEAHPSIDDRTYIGLVAATSPRNAWDSEDASTDGTGRFPNLDSADLVVEAWEKNPDVTVTQEMIDGATTKERHYDPDLVGQTMPFQDLPNGPLMAEAASQAGLLVDSPRVVMKDPAGLGFDILLADQHGLDPSEVITGEKRLAFFDNLATRGESPNTTTIDALMTAALTGRDTNLPKGPDGHAVPGGLKAPPGYIDMDLLDNKHPNATSQKAEKAGWDPHGTAYRLLDAAVLQAAKNTGYESPSDAQAVLWYVFRDYDLKILPDELKEQKK